MPHIRRLLLTGFLAWLVGASLATAFFLLWMDVDAIRDSAAWNDAPGRIMFLPFAVPVALAFSFPVAIVPTYIMGWLVSIVLGRLRIHNVLVRCCFGAAVGGVVGWGMLSRLEQGGLLGLLYGAAIGTAWFACERRQVTASGPA